jgi:hypothetical protein
MTLGEILHLKAALLLTLHTFCCTIMNLEERERSVSRAKAKLAMDKVRRKSTVLQGDFMYDLKFLTSFLGPGCK